MADKGKIIIIAVLGISLIFLSVHLLTISGRVKTDSQKIYELTRQLDSAQGFLSGKEILVSELKTELSSLSNVRAVKNSLMASREMIRKLSFQLRNLEKANNILRNRTVLFDNRLNSNTKQIKRLLTELSEKKNKISELQSNLSDSSYRKENQKLSSSLSKSQRDSRLIARQFEDLKGQYAELKEEAGARKINTANADLQKKIARLSDEIKEKEQSISKLIEVSKRDLDEKANSFKTIAAKTNGLQAELAKKEEDISGLKQIISRLQYGRDKEKELDSSNEELKNQIAKISAELNSKKKEITSLKETTKKYLAAEAVSAEALNTEAKRLEDDLDKKDDELNELKNNFTHLKYEGEKEKELNINLQKQLTQSTKTLQEKENEVRRLEKRFQEQRFVSLNAKELQVLQKKLYTQKNELKGVEERYANLKKQLISIGETLSQREVKLEVSKKEIVKLRDDIIYLKSNLKYWETNFSENKNHQEHLLGELSKVLDLNAMLQKRLTEVSAVLSDELVIDKVNKAGLALKSKSSKMAQRDDPIITYEDSGEEYKQKVDELKKEVEVILEGVKGTEK